MKKRVLLGLAAAAALLALGSLAIHQADAADHTDPASVAGDPEDIADLYAWVNDSTDVFYAIITIDGNKVPATGQAGTYSRDSLFSLYVDEDGDLSNGSDNRITFRFAQDGVGAWGVQADGIPGETSAIEGAVESTLTGSSGAKVFVGLKDDPFFFDFTDFVATATSIGLNMAPDDDDLKLGAPTIVDTFQGNNATVIAIEIPLANFGTGVTDLQVWAASATIGS